jgi:hypothetical protein
MKVIAHPKTGVLEKTVEEASCADSMAAGFGDNNAHAEFGGQDK